ncbi:hypothetical protein GCM10028814_00850 [Angustibacter aerolatus]
MLRHQEGVGDHREHQQQHDRAHQPSPSPTPPPGVDRWPQRLTGLTGLTRLARPAGSVRPATGPHGDRAGRLAVRVVGAPAGRLAGLPRAPDAGPGRGVGGAPTGLLTRPGTRTTGADHLGAVGVVAAAVVRHADQRRGAASAFTGPAQAPHPVPATSARVVGAEPARPVPVG